MYRLLVLLFAIGCAPVDEVDPVPLACEIVAASDDCVERRLVCCIDAATCWVESSDEAVECQADSCADALDALCVPPEGGW